MTVSARLVRNLSDSALIHSDKGGIGLKNPFKLRFRLQAVLAGMDVAALLCATEAAERFWLGRSVVMSDFAVVSAFIAFYLIAGLNGGIFTAEMLSHRRRSVWAAMRTVALAATGVILGAFFLKTGEQISRVDLVITGAIGTLLVGALRATFLRWTLRRYGPQLQSEVLLIDDCPVSAPPGVRVLDAADVGLRCDLSDPLMLDRIGRFLASADRVVISCRLERRRNWAMVLKGANIRGEIISPELTEIGPLATGQFGDCATVVVAAGSLDLRQRLLKRSLDMTLAIAVLILLAPLLLAAVIAIRLDSPGPVLFVQQRVGRGNRLFGIYKFRSMHASACDHQGHKSTDRGDQRITRVGRWMRITSIDELPQLVNILRGEMSFVGPRPHALGSLAGDQLFWEIDERYWHRHVCKPGMTGLAQVRGHRGTTHRPSDLIDRLQADLEYVAGWTIFRDISILLATLRVLVHRNAY